MHRGCGILEALEVGVKEWNWTLEPTEFFRKHKLRNIYWAAESVLCVEHLNVKWLGCPGRCSVTNRYLDCLCPLVITR